MHFNGYFLLFSLFIVPCTESASANDAPPTIKKTFQFYDDPMTKSAYLSVKAGGEESNATITIPATSNIPHYAVFPPFGFADSAHVQDVLAKGKELYPNWNPEVMKTIETFFIEFSSPEQITKGVNWQKAKRLKDIGKKANQTFDAEIDDIMRYHDRLSR